MKKRTVLIPPAIGLSNPQLLRSVIRKVRQRGTPTKHVSSERPSHDATVFRFSFCLRFASDAISIKSRHWASILVTFSACSSVTLRDSGWVGVRNPDVTRDIIYGRPLTVTHTMGVKLSSFGLSWTESDQASLSSGCGAWCRHNSCDTGAPGTNASADVLAPCPADVICCSLFTSSPIS